MLNICLLTVIMVLCVLGIYFLSREIIAAILKNNTRSCVVIEVLGGASGVEDTIRTALNANPESEIIIMNKSCDNEVSGILAKMATDSSRIHIKEVPEKIIREPQINRFSRF
ncbi:MAG: hypothetical protein LIO53_08055 [Oscillospiraceae bacterium]|nr:hypothetical protein [Oscillospiraceae bacterium]